MTKNNGTRGKPEHVNYGGVLPTLTERVPGAALAAQELLDAHGELADVRGRLQDVTEVNHGLTIEVKQITEDLAATVAECDDLSARVLPSLPGAVYAETTEPVGALIAEQMDAEQAAPGFKGWV